MTIRFRPAEADGQVDDERAAQRIYMGSALTMEPGTLLQTQLPLHNDYSLSSDPECLDQFSGHAHHQSYNNNGAVEPLRRDPSLVQQSSGAFAYATTGNTPGPRYVPGQNVAPDGRSYPTTQNFTDSGSGSISTSPSSAASSLAYNTYQQANHYTGAIPTYPGPVPLPQAFVTQSYAGARVPSILDTSSQGGLPPPNRSPLSGTANAADRDLYTNTSPYLGRSQLSPTAQAGYPNYADSSRVLALTEQQRVLSGTAALSLNGFTPTGYQPLPHMAASNSHSYHAMSSESLNFPWPTLEVLLELNCDGVPVTPEVHAKVEKGFFLSTVDDKWTCYRRNYFAVNCHFELHPNIHNGRLTIKRNNVTEHVMAMGMRLSAAVDGSQGKSIELIQHTPKRDNGPKNKIDVTKVSPAHSGRQDSTISPNGVYQVPMHTFHATGHPTGPNLPFQSKPDDGSSHAEVTPTSLYAHGVPGAAHNPIPGSATQHTFERVQFKQATANNGKRRASQQYFHLVVELFVDIRKTEQDNPSWVKIAQRVSEKIVVRGRSPSHYQNENQGSGNGRGGATGHSGGCSTGGASYGGMNAGGFRSSGSHYSGGSISGGSNGYRSNHYGMQVPTESHSGSSSSSIDGGHVDGYQVDSVMSDADRLAIHEPDGYQYYPSTIYEGMATQLPPLGKIKTNAHYSTEPRQYAVKAEYSDAIPGAQFSANGIGRFQGVESSRGYYPDLQTGCS